MVNILHKLQNFNRFDFSELFPIAAVFFTYTITGVCDSLRMASRSGVAVHIGCDGKGRRISSLRLIKKQNDRLKMQNRYVAGPTQIKHAALNSFSPRSAIASSSHS